MGVLDGWLLLNIPNPGLYFKTHIQSVYNAIRRKLKSRLIAIINLFRRKSIIRLSVSLQDSTRLIWGWKTANMDYSLYMCMKKKRGKKNI